jgi:hypothetical protein
MVSVKVKRSGHGAWYPYIVPIKDGVIMLAPQVREVSQPDCQRPDVSGISLWGDSTGVGICCCHA